MTINNGLTCSFTFTADTSGLDHAEDAARRLVRRVAARKAAHSLRLARVVAIVEEIPPEYWPGWVGEFVDEYAQLTGLDR